MKISLAFLCALCIHIPFFPSSCAGSTQSLVGHGISKSLTISNPVSATSAAVSSSSIIVSSSAVSSTITSATVTSSAQAIQIVDPTTLDEIATIHERRLSSIIGALTGANNITAWLSTLGPDGKWPDSEVDYTTGCTAIRANWPAEVHWERILVMAAAWHGGLQGADQFVKDPMLRAAISLAMNYWFGRDFTNLACLDSGGTASCPCTNPDNSLNTNWFSNIILIPELVGQSCLLLNDTLAPSQLSNCTHMTGRSYGTFDHSINGVGFLTGANTLDVAKIGIDNALLNVNVSMLTDAYRRVHLELTIKDPIKADGIREDGSFGQHAGILYNGNYGKDYTNDILDLEIEAGGTEFAANSTSQTALATLFDGDHWMIYRNVITGILHWDFSVLGRFISFPVIDAQATGSININLTEVGVLGQQWGSSALTNFATSLSQNSSTANAGNLQGNRMFFDNDYMVHRGQNYISTLKMYSTRTLNTECTNSQNPLGFHLADGVVYTYLQGDEYEDISVAWDWNLIPGITVDYNATPLNCDNTRFTGIESFVGGASDGNIGAAAMRYTNPLTKALHWQKAWFFLEDDVQHVMISNISSKSNASVFSVLDQKKHSGPILIDGVQRQISSFQGGQSLWHDNVGYTFQESNGAVTLSVQVGPKSGNWSTIGTSTQPPATVDLFAAWLEHESLATSVSYTVFPGTDSGTFLQKSKQLRLQSIQNDGNISAVLDAGKNIAMAVFWNAGGGTFTFTPAIRGAAAITVTSNANAVLIYKVDEGEVTLSDPSQTLNAANITLCLGRGRRPALWGSGREKDLVFQFPSGGLAGSSVLMTLS